MDNDLGEGQQAGEGPSIEEQSLLALMSKGPTVGPQYQLITTELRNRLTRMLTPFTTDPARFLRHLHNNHAVISGSFALKWAVGDTWEVGDLDVYIPKGRMNRIRGVMCDQEGYIVATTHPEDHGDDDRYGENLADDVYPEGGILRVMTMTRDDRSLQIIESTTPSATYPITQFWSTAQMNFLTSTSFTCAYPSLTLHNVAVLNPRVVDEEGQPLAHVVPLIEKYEERGFHFHSKPEAAVNSLHTESTVTTVGGRYGGWEHQLRDWEDLFSRVRAFDDDGCLTVYYRGNALSIETGRPAQLYQWRSAWIFGGFMTNHRVMPLCYTFNTSTGLPYVLKMKDIPGPYDNRGIVPHVLVVGTKRPVDLKSVERQDDEVTLVFDLK